jgi:hypothetical protein
LDALYESIIGQTNPWPKTPAGSDQWPKISLRLIPCLRSILALNTVHIRGESERVRCRAETLINKEFENSVGDIETRLFAIVGILRCVAGAQIFEKLLSVECQARIARGKNLRTREYLEGC